MKQKLYVLLLLLACNLVLSSLLAADEDKKTVLVWGDSLSAAYGLKVEQGWVHLLDEKLGQGWQVVNSSISGETTEGGLTRLPEALKTHQPDILLIALGSNDGLRGIALDVTRQNLERMIQQAQAIETKVVLVGAKIPPNYGLHYSEQFEAIFTDLVKQYKIAHVPFLLEGIADKFELFQDDGLHPTAEAQPVLLDNVWPALESLLKQRGEGNE